MKLARPGIADVGGAKSDVGATRLKAVQTMDLPFVPVVNHLMMIDRRLVLLGNIITGAEVMGLPWRIKKTGELAFPKDIGKDIALVEALYVHGRNQGPEEFKDTKCFIREDIK